MIQRVHCGLVCIFDVLPLLCCEESGLKALEYDLITVADLLLLDLRLMLLSTQSKIKENTESE